jgi:hypothetical protein
LGKSQIRAVASDEPVTSIRVSGESDTQFTLWVWPRQVALCFQVDADQSFTYLSIPAEINVRLSGVNSTLRTWLA